MDDFLASVLASPSPQKQAPLAGIPDPPPATAAAAAAAAAAEVKVEAAVPAADAAPEAAEAAAEAAAGGEPMAVDGDGSKDAAEEMDEAEQLPPITADQRRLLHWHWANLEYGCSARLEEVRRTGSSGAGRWPAGAQHVHVGRRVHGCRCSAPLGCCGALAP